VQTSTQNAVGVLDEVLNYDKIERRSLNLEKRLIPVWQLIERSLKDFKLSASMKSIRIEASYDVEDGVTHVLEIGKRHSISALPERAQQLRLVGDPVRLRQVIANLLSNAIKFSADDSVVQVRASWEDRNNKASKDLTMKKTVMLDEEEVTVCESGYLKVSVVDTGPGITNEQLRKLFQEGVQFNANELQAGRGSGLGLHITKGIVEQHLGKITATSEGLKKGATFTVTLPLYTVPDTSPASNCDASNSDPIDIDRSKHRDTFLNLRVLIVDDVLSNRKLLNRLLTKRRNVCEEAEDGEIAIKMVEDAMAVNKPYDAILLDYEMPVTNGPQAAERIRRMGCDSIIIGVTGNMLPEDVAYFRSCGANGVVPKPVKVKTLEKMWTEFKSSFVSGEFGLSGEFGP
jgi:CheY-like chemotaxis protein